MGQEEPGGVLNGQAGRPETKVTYKMARQGYYLVKKGRESPSETEGGAKWRSDTVSRDITRFGR